MARRARAPAAIAALALAAACGIRGAPPSPKAPAAVAALKVEARDGAVRIAWKGDPSAARERLPAFDVLRRADDPEARGHFVPVGAVPAAGAGRYELYDRTVDPGRRYSYRVQLRVPVEAPPEAIRYRGPERTISWELPPAAPTGVSATPLHMAARVHWEPVERAAGYRVYEVGDDGRPLPEPMHRGLLDRSPWTAVGLPDGRPFSFVVRSVRLVDAVSTSVDGDAGSAGPAPEEAPFGPSAAEVSDAALEGVAIPAAAVARRAGGSFLGTTALPGIESVSSEVVSVVPGVTEPAPPPTRVSLASTAEGIALSWRTSTGEQVVGYHVERRALDVDGMVSPGAEWRRLTERPVAASGWVDREVKKGKRYEYRVRAVDASGTEGASSPPKSLAWEG